MSSSPADGWRAWRLADDLARRYSSPPMLDRPTPQALRVAFLAADDDEARRALAKLKERYAHVSEDEADVIVALGGDGMMLETLHRFIERDKPIFGMNRGTVGFL